MENIPVSIVVVKLLQLPSNGLHNIVSDSNFIVVDACLPRSCIATAVVSSVPRSSPSNGSMRYNTLLLDVRIRSLKLKHHSITLSLTCKQFCGLQILANIAESFGNERLSPQPPGIIMIKQPSNKKALESHTDGLFMK
jgi:hypothetical protein